MCLSVGLIRTVSTVLDCVWCRTPHLSGVTAAFLISSLFMSEFFCCCSEVGQHHGSAADN